MNPVSSIRILIVDDEKAARYGMVKALRPEGYHVSEAEDGLSAMTLMQADPFDIIITDVTMPGMNGIDLLKKIKELRPEVFVVVITAHGSERLAVEAIKSGAFNYLPKPYDIEELRALVGHAAQQVLITQENIQLKKEIREIKGFGQFVGETAQMRKIYDLIERVSKNNITVLIRGESGTGKELVARTIHDQSDRRKGPFQSINCAALPRDLIESELFGYEKGAFTGAVSTKQGKFEAANGGTLFLDEIGDMSPDTQAKVLRVIQERKFERVGGTESISVDVRILSATHRDLSKLIREGLFREDLFYRINVVEIELPPLRARNADVVSLSNYYLNFFAKKHDVGVKHFSQDALKKMMDYEWPGNVRELINVVERCVVLSSTEEIPSENLPGEITHAEKPSSSLGVREMLESGDVSFQDAKHRVVQTFEREFFLEAMRLQNWNISQTAIKLGMKRQYLQQKLKELGLNIQEEKENV